jgi:hypothetical protein
VLLLVAGHEMMRVRVSIVYKYHYESVGDTSFE